MTRTAILIAVLVDSFNQFADGLSSVSVEGRSLDERVRVFVDAAWEHFASPHYRCTFEILLNMPTLDWDSPEHPLRESTLEAWASVWNRFFGEADLPLRRTIAVQYYAISVLSGLAAMKKLEGPTAAQRRTELGFLKDTLVRELG